MLKNVDMERSGAKYLQQKLNWNLVRWIRWYSSRYSGFGDRIYPSESSR